VEAFGDPVRLGLLQESVAGLNPPEARLVDEMVGKVLRPVISSRSLRSHLLLTDYLNSVSRRTGSFSPLTQATAAKT